ncbi:CaiB/BaiF CoA transferase family protein [Sabulicella rubraurantiaca]|uniref:CaiB/BaiF CoA transferase family protein n=1 Tax=Sabulicella rubraurantiaca TaxID=2811429 RepID=UPI001A9637F5|nr:CaiB/BaiF CoA-transferase family protein [Sabulicella rubraurantiaca]
MSGPLAGLRILEMPAIGPAPMAAMILAGMGAEVLRIARPEPADLGSGQPPERNLLNRGRPAVALDLKSAEGQALALRLAAQADALVEGFRPGVMERLGLGPAECHRVNPRLVYGRVTGWGQEGPLSRCAGHDLNYIALTGALHAIGRRSGLPAPPLALLGDFAGGALHLVVGMLAALLERGVSGRGQVVDAAVADGTAALMTMFHGLLASGRHAEERGTNLLDSGAFFYDVYPCADGKLVAVAPIEERFFAEFLQRIGLPHDAFPRRLDPSTWPAAREVLAAHLRTRSRDEWCALLEGSDACFAPVLTMEEAPHHPHAKARGAYVEVGGVVQPAPAPRFSRAPSPTPAPPAPDRGNPATLTRWGVEPEEIERLAALGVVA